MSTTTTENHGTVRLDVLAREASADGVRLAAAVLRDDAANGRWRAQLGPCLSQGATADLLGITPQAVAKRAVGGDLLRLVHRDGRPVYPTFQFDGRRTVAGLASVLAVLLPVDDTLTVAAWLTAAKPALSRATPIEALRDGDLATVLDLADDYVVRST